MFQEIAKIKTGATSQPQHLPHSALSVQEAHAMLEAEYGDPNAVSRAFKMLGERSLISPKEYKRLTVVIPKIIGAQNMGSDKGSNNGSLSPSALRQRYGGIANALENQLNAGLSNANKSNPGSVRRLGANSMMKQTKVVPSANIAELREVKKALFQKVSERKASVDVSRNKYESINLTGQTSFAKKPSGQASANSGLLALNATGQTTGNKFHLPGLGRTVSHCMTPAAARNSNGFQFTSSKEMQGAEHDYKVMDLLAKQAFMKLDDRTLKAFREQGKTPNLERSSKHMLSPLENRTNNANNLRMTQGSAMSPTSQRSNIDISGLGKLGQMGAVQDKEQDRFWSEVIDNDQRRHRMETEQRQLLKLRKNQEVQNYLKGQMDHVEQQKAHNLHKKSMDALDVKQKTKEFIQNTREMKQVKRNIITETQNYNLSQFDDKLNQQRANVDHDRSESQRIAMEQIQHASFLDQMEKSEIKQKRMQHRKELEQLIKERANMNKASQQPVTSETLLQLKLLPEQAQKLMMQEANPTLKYSDPKTGLMASLVENKYTVQHLKKVSEQDQRVDMFVKSHERLLPAHIEAKEKRYRDPKRAALGKNNSKGLVALMDGDDKRKEGTTEITRLIQQENVAARKQRQKNELQEKALNLKEDQKMNSYLEKISREHHNIEQWQKSNRKQQMLENIQESLRLREQIDREKANQLIEKEAKINKLYRA